MNRYAIQGFGPFSQELAREIHQRADDATSSMLLAKARSLATAPAGLRSPAALVLPRRHN